MSSIMNRSAVIEAIEARRLIAIIRGAAPETAVPIAEALLKGGIGLIEVTFNQKQPETFYDTCTAIRAITETFGGEVLAGAGTVLTCAQADMAREAGAKYIISPNVNPAVIRHTVESGLVSLPGAMTPTEILAADEAGADFVKLFPAAELGTGYIKAIRAPISHVRLLAVGGIHAGNIADFLKAGCVGAGVGGQLVSREAIAAGDWAAITRGAAALRQLVKEVDKLTG